MEAGCGSRGQEATFGPVSGSVSQAASCHGQGFLLLLCAQILMQVFSIILQDCDHRSFQGDTQPDDRASCPHSSLIIWTCLSATLLPFF